MASARDVCPPNVTVSKMVRGGAAAAVATAAAAAAAVAMFTNLLTYFHHGRCSREIDCEEAVAKRNVRRVLQE